MGSLHLGFDENYMNRSVSLLSSRVTPVEPSLGEDDVVEVGVGVDDAGRAAPRAPQVDVARPRHDASHEREPRVLRRALALLSRQRSVGRRDRVDPALLCLPKNQIQFNSKLSVSSIYITSTSRCKFACFLGVSKIIVVCIRSRRIGRSRK